MNGQTKVLLELRPCQRLFLKRAVKVSYTCARRRNELCVNCRVNVFTQRAGCSVSKRGNYDAHVLTVREWCITICSVLLTIYVGIPKRGAYIASQPSHSHRRCGCHRKDEAATSDRRVGPSTAASYCVHTCVNVLCEHDCIPRPIINSTNVCAAILRVGACRGRGW